MKKSLNRLRAEYVREQVDGFDYIKRYVNLKKVGNVFQGRCPFHQERTGSFTVFPAGIQGRTYTSFYCFGCGVGGDVIEFKRLQEHVSRAEALALLEQEFNLDVAEEQLQQRFLAEQLHRIKYQDNQVLSLSEVNLLCSCMCRNYLQQLRERGSASYERVRDQVELFYRYLDEQLLQRSAVEAVTLVDETRQLLLELSKISS